MAPASPKGPTTAARVRATLAALERAGKRRVREDMSKRYGIVVKKAWGVPMGAMQKVAKGLGRDHALAPSLERGVSWQPLAAGSERCIRARFVRLSTAGL